jgi:hypothetical protein
MGIGVDREEKLGFGLLGARHPLAERHELVAAPGQHHLISTAQLELSLQFARDLEDDALFLGSGNAQSARIEAAMARIESDQFGPGN